MQGLQEMCHLLKSLETGSDRCGAFIELGKGGEGLLQRHLRLIILVIEIVINCNMCHMSLVTCHL